MHDNPTPPIYPGLSMSRLLWLVRLRWYALAGVTLATAAAALGVNPGVNLPVLIGALVTGVLFNLYFWKQVRVSQLSPRDGMLQVLVDIGALTLVLWAGGGAEVPFRSFYFFHIIIGGILVGPRAAIITTGVAVLAVAFLEGTRYFPRLQISHWSLPGPGWQWAVELAGLGLTAVFLAYFVTHIMNELHSQLRAVATQRERAANALARLTFTLDRMDAGMEVLDHSGRRIWFNQTFQQLFPGHDLGAAWACPGAHPGCDEAGCPVSQTFGASSAHRCMLRVSPGDEGPQVYELISYPLSSDRSAPQVMNLYLNRTREQTLQRRVEQAERLAAFGRLAQGLAHELNTPLGTVHTLATDIGEVVRDLGGHEGDGPAMATGLADIADSCAIIQDESRRCRNITTTLLSGRDLYGEDHPRSVDLRRLIDHSCVVAFRGEGSRPEVRVSAPEGLLLETDPDRVLQVLLNVLGNASDAVGPGGLIEVSAGPDGDDVIIQICDQGPGFSQEALERLFEPFFTSKDPGQGTGLGLYTSYLIVQRLGGHIEVENRAAGGSNVSIRLPRRNLAASPPFKAPSDGGRTGADGQRPSPLSQALSARPQE